MRSRHHGDGHGDRDGSYRGRKTGQGNGSMHLARLQTGESGLAGHCTGVQLLPPLAGSMG
jgi:hypothetical protein